MKKINFSIIGYGNIGIRHAGHIMMNEDCKLLSICDIDTTVRDSIPQGVLFYSNFDDLLKDKEVDVVCICTPNYLHEFHTILALSAGKHVVVEKPMALSVAECNRMIEASLRSGKAIFAVKQNRYNPPVNVAKELVEQGSLGKIYLIQVNCFWNRGDSYYTGSDWRGKKGKDGGCLFTQFSHFVDILYYLNGTVERCSGFVENFAHTHNTEVEDTGAFVLKASNGAIINFNFTTCSFQSNMEGSITLFGEKGTVKIGGQYLNTIEYQKIEAINLPEINISAKANDYGKYQGSMSNHDKVIQNVVDVLLYNAPIMTTAEEGREVIRIIEQMYHGAA